MIKRVLHVITLSEWGGAQQVCFDIATRLDKERFNVEVACSPGGVLVERLRAAGIRVHEMPYFERNPSPWNDVRGFLGLRRLIRSGHFDIVHCHSTKAGILGRFAAKLSGVRRILFTVHGWGFYNQEESGRLRPLIILLERWAARISEKLICVSENDRKQGLANRIAPPQKFIVIRNGVQWQRPEMKSNLRLSIHAQTDDVVFGTVGRLAFQKNPQLFIEAASEVCRQRSNCRFALIGDGPLYDECRGLIASLGLEEKIVLMGFQQSISSLLVGLDVFVLSSRFEGLPLTIIEAMFAGLPVIGAAVGGNAEAVEQDRGGFLVPPNDQQALASAMMALADNKQLRLEMGLYNSERALAEFSVDNMLGKYEELYLQR